MAVTLTIHQKREVIPTGYKITSTITAAAGIPTELFLFKQSDNVYQHVCTVDDIGRYPHGTSPTIDFYREPAAVLTYTTDQLADAIEEAALQKTRLSELVGEYDDASTDFVGEEDTSYTS
jgi:hypothetical protein